MTTRLTPYLNFRGQARPAFEFYQSVFGGELTSSSFAEFGVSQDPAEADHVMHAQLETPGGLVLMGSDVPKSMDLDLAGHVSVSLSAGPDGEAELRGYWEKFADGATIAMPMDKAPWGDIFGSLTDKFGVHWLFNISGTQQ